MKKQQSITMLGHRTHIAESEGTDISNMAESEGTDLILSPSRKRTHIKSLALMLLILFSNAIWANSITLFSAEKDSHKGLLTVDGTVYFLEGYLDKNNGEFLLNQSLSNPDANSKPGVGDIQISANDDGTGGSTKANDDGTGGTKANDDGTGGSNANDDGTGILANDDGTGGTHANDDGTGTPAILSMSCSPQTNQLVVMVDTGKMKQAIQIDQVTVDGKTHTCQ